MQIHQELAKGVGSGSFPSPILYNLIFLTAALISVISVLIVMILNRRMTQSSLKNQKWKRPIKKHAARAKEVGNDD
jgi:hypothetical protein